jgi:hypothetical protein
MSHKMAMTNKIVVKISRALIAILLIILKKNFSNPWTPNLFLLQRLIAEVFDQIGDHGNTHQIKKHKSPRLRAHKWPWEADGGGEQVAEEAQPGQADSIYFYINIYIQIIIYYFF